jgi:adenylate cyclase
VERKLAAILAADVVGYSRLVREDEEATILALRTLRQDLIDLKINEYRGRIVKLMGDGILVEFTSVVDAVACGAEVQRAVAERNTGSPQSRRIVFRVGVNLGDVIIDGDDIQGDGVNVAARLEALSEPGGMCISDAVYEQVRDRLGLSFEELGEQKVKNINRPVRAWKWSESSGLAATPSSSLEASLPLPDKPSIAVLPFDNRSGDPEQEYFADGIAEDIITGLSRIRWFFVCARNSSFLYKGRSVDIKQVSRDLGVRYVLEGSVRKSGSRARITTQLIDATTGNHLWAERYDRDLHDIFAVQDEITETVVATIEPQLYVAESDRSRRKDLDNIDAWDMTMQAMSHLWRMNGPDNSRAQELLRHAVELDPHYAAAYGPLGFSYIWHAWMGWGDNPTQLIPKADSAARRALALDDQDPWSHLAMAGVYAYRRQHEDAVDRLRTCLDLNPSFALAHVWLGIVMGYAGRLEDSIDAIDRATRISPRDPFNASFPVLRSIAYFTAKSDEDARNLAYETIKVRPEMVGAWRIALVTSAHMGDLEAAKRALSEVKRLQPTISLAWAREYSPWVRPQDLERYIEGLRIAGLE